jgi:hypothetical protein
MAAAVEVAKEATSALVDYISLFIFFTARIEELKSTPLIYLANFSPSIARFSSLTTVFFPSTTLVVFSI